MELYDACVEAGLEIDHHESDLYIEGTSAARDLLRERWVYYTLFTDQVTGKTWYDVPFMYMPFWREKGHTKEKIDGGQAEVAPEE